MKPFAILLIGFLTFSCQNSHVIAPNSFGVMTKHNYDVGVVYSMNRSRGIMKRYGPLFFDSSVQDKMVSKTEWRKDSSLTGSSAELNMLELPRFYGWTSPRIIFRNLVSDEVKEESVVEQVLNLRSDRRDELAESYYSALRRGIWESSGPRSGGLERGEEWCYVAFTHIERAKEVLLSFSSTRAANRFDSSLKQRGWQRLDCQTFRKQGTIILGGKGVRLKMSGTSNEHEVYLEHFDF